MDRRRARFSDRGKSGIAAGDTATLRSASDLGALEQALALAYRHLNRRERTVAEMRAHLRGRGLDHAVVEQAVRELVAQRYLDDARYARLYVQDKRRLEGWGGERIRRELVARGIDGDSVEMALDDDGEEQELHRAVQLLRKRIARQPGDNRERERALGILLRKGYDYELALQAIRALARE